MILELRLAEPTEAGVAADIIRRSFEAQAEALGIQEPDCPSYVAFETPERVLQRMERGESVVLGLIDRETIGTVSYQVLSTEDRKGTISRLAVLPGYRGNQLGLELMLYAEERLNQEGVSVVELSIVAQFSRLRQYYEMQGYIAQGTETFPTLPFEVLLLVKSMEQG